MSKSSIFKTTLISTTATGLLTAMGLSLPMVLMTSGTAYAAECANVGAGTTDADDNNDPGALACGNDAQATGNDAVAIGANTRATTIDAIAIGFIADAMGADSQASSDRSTALGGNSDATGNSSTAVGHRAQSTGLASIAIGGANADGSAANALADYAISIGFNSSATALESLALGRDAVSSNEDGIAIGTRAVSTTDTPGQGGGVAIGGDETILVLSVQDRLNSVLPLVWIAMPHVRRSPWVQRRLRLHFAVSHSEPIQIAPARPLSRLGPGRMY